MTKASRSNVNTIALRIMMMMEETGLRVGDEKWKWKSETFMNIILTNQHSICHFRNIRTDKDFHVRGMGCC